MDQILVLIFQLVALIFSVIVHEVSHGVMALRLGDTTAKDAGRLTLNPVKHLDLFGSFIVPLTLFILSSGSFVIGWAKPVPYNPFNLKNPKLGAGLIGAAGPLSNFILAVIFGLLIRFLAPYADIQMIATLIYLFNIVVFVNILLGVFNLVPLPPLDGSNILFSFLPRSLAPVRLFLERYGFYLLIAFMFFGFQLIVPIIEFLYRLIVGSVIGA